MLHRYIAGRLGGALVTLVGVAILIFCLARLMPGDPAAVALGDGATLEQIETYRQQLGLDQPIPVQFVNYVASVARGDFGISLMTGSRVTEDLAGLVPATLELVLFATILMIGIGLPLGILAGRWRDGFFDNFTRVLSLLGVVTPNFVWAICLMLLFAYHYEILPVMGRLSIDMQPPPHYTGMYLIDSVLAGRWDAFSDAFAHILLPAIALSLASIGQTARIARANVGESYDQTYIEFARAYGFKESRIATKYALRPALIPTLTILGLDIAIKFGGAFLIETIFVWPGMARYGVRVILAKDLNAIVGTVIVIGFLFILINLLVDIIVALVDPRIRLTGART